MRAEWSTKQSLEDIERQIRGEDITLVDTTASTDSMTPAQQKMFDALRVPLINDHDAQMQRRSAAIKSLMAYCLEEERRIVKVVPTPKRPSELASESSPQQQLEMIKQSTLAEFTRDIRRCFLCVAKAETLGVDHPRFDELCHPFARSGTLARHFITAHLDAVAADDSTECPVCKVTLIHRQHLQNHTEIVHGIRTDQYQIQEAGKQEVNLRANGPLELRLVVEQCLSSLFPVWVPS